MRLKTLWVVLLAVGALVFTLDVATRHVVLDGFARAEREDTARKVLDTRSIVTTMAHEFSERGNDWADWDDLATFLADGNAEFYAANVDHDSFAGIGWDVFMVVAADGAERAAVMRDRDKGAFTTVPPEFRVHLPRLMAPGEPTAGFAMVGHVPFLVSSRPVRKTDKTPGPIEGRFITARQLDTPWVERLERFTFLSIGFTGLTSAPRDEAEARARAALTAGQDTWVEAVDDQHIAGWTTVADIQGRPMLSMRVSRDRALRAHGEAVIEASTIAVVIAGVALALLSLLLMGKSVIEPLARLLDGVQRLEAGEHVQVRLARKDEVGRLGAAFDRMASTLVDRERSLRDAHARTRLVLDSTGDALLSCTPEGTLSPEASAAAVTWFGEPRGAVWAYLPAPDDLKTRESLRLGMEQLADDILPWALCVDQLPRRFVRDGRTFGVEYRPVGGERDVLLIVRDVSAKVDAERAEREAQELRLVVGHLMRDPEDLERYAEEARMLLGRLDASDRLDQQRRDVHTLKGSSAIMGFLGFSEVCHQLEQALSEQACGLRGEQKVALRRAWDESHARVAALTSRARDGRVHLERHEHAEFMQMLAERADHGLLVEEARAWAYQPVSGLFARIEGQVERLAQQLGKKVEVVLDHHDVRVDARPLVELMGTLVHVVRNAVDHGVETPRERMGLRKPAKGCFTVRTLVAGGFLELDLSDDGRGVAWSRVASRARALGLPFATQADLVEALYHDGLSTRDEVSATSGRGVGLSAVRGAVLALGGTLRVVSEHGRGTRFEIRLPLARELGGPGVVAWMPPERPGRTRPIRRSLPVRRSIGASWLPPAA